LFFYRGGGEKLLKIKEIREEQNLTAVQLAQKMKIDLKTIWRWENGKNAITSDKLVLIADALNCTVDELLGREPTEPAANSIKITPLARRLLEAFYEIEEVDQHKLVAMAEALATMS